MASKEDAIAALEDYGYTEFPDGKYRKLGRQTQVWEPADGGFLRYDTEGGQEVKQIHSVGPKGQGLAGLHKDTHDAEFFNWVYPFDEIEKIYRGATVIHEPDAPDA